MAFILVQHLDPTHASLMVELLAPHTSLTVLQAADGMPVEREHLYIIPPAFFLTIGDGILRLRPAPASRGARLPFDALLLSMAQDCGARATCVVLSGTGADGSVGLLAIKRNGGVVIAQEPSEAGYDGMPRSAIATGVVDAVLPVAAMPGALARGGPQAVPPSNGSSQVEQRDGLPDIIDLLRARTTHDFTLYKPGTLKRRVERRMAMAAIGINEMGRYVAALRDDPAELERLAKDLLIHVTGFFRDPAVLRTAGPDGRSRTYSWPSARPYPAHLGRRMQHRGRGLLPRDGLPRADRGRQQRRQVAGSSRRTRMRTRSRPARDGLYPATIEADVTPARLAAFFIKEDQSYRVLPELRAMVVFTVQDLLADPPFSPPRPGCRAATS